MTGSAASVPRRERFPPNRGCGVRPAGDRHLKSELKESTDAASLHVTGPLGVRRCLPDARSGCRGRVAGALAVAARLASGLRARRISGGRARLERATLRRTVNGRPAHVPLDVYMAFLDTPEVTAAAARFRKVANFEIRAVDDDHYVASDGDGARGVAQVL